MSGAAGAAGAGPCESEAAEGTTSAARSGTWRRAMAVAVPSTVTAIEVVTVVLVSPLLVGLMRQVRARLEGRAGAGIGQPWRDLRKLARRQPTTPEGTGWAFRLRISQPRNGTRNSSAFAM